MENPTIDHSLIDLEKLNSLLGWMFISMKEGLISVIVLDKESNKIASLVKDDENELVFDEVDEYILRAIKFMFTDSDSVGTMTIDTKHYRLLLSEAGTDNVLILVAEKRLTLEYLFPYIFLCSEKVTRVLNGQVVSPIIPNLQTKIEEHNEPFGALSEILLKEGSFSMKMVLCGDSGVGKTTLVAQFIDEEFKTDFKSTIGVSIMSKSVSFPIWRTTADLMIYDMAGQDQFESVRSTYYLNAKAGFLVYDITSRESFNNIETWVDEVKESAPGVMLFLIGNKVDLKEKRCVSKEEGMKLAEKLQIPFMETSALIKGLVDETFRIIAFSFISRGRIARIRSLPENKV